MFVSVIEITAACDSTAVRVNVKQFSTNTRAVQNSTPPPARRSTSSVISGAITW
jgi:hypothetical protein